MSWMSPEIARLRHEQQVANRELALKERQARLASDPGHIFMSALMQAIPNSTASALGTMAVDAAKYKWFGGERKDIESERKQAYAEYKDRMLKFPHLRNKESFAELERLSGGRPVAAAGQPASAASSKAGAKPEAKPEAKPDPKIARKDVAQPSLSDVQQGRATAPGAIDLGNGVMALDDEQYQKFQSYIQENYPGLYKGPEAAQRQGKPTIITAPDGQGGQKGYRRLSKIESTAYMNQLATQQKQLQRQAREKQAQVTAAEQAMASQGQKYPASGQTPYGDARYMTSDERANWMAEGRKALKDWNADFNTKRKAVIDTLGAEPDNRRSQALIDAMIASVPTLHPSVQPKAIASIKGMVPTLPTNVGQRVMNQLVTVGPGSAGVLSKFADRSGPNIINTGLRANHIYEAQLELTGAWLGQEKTLKSLDAIKKKEGSWTPEQQKLWDKTMRERSLTESQFKANSVLPNIDRVVNPQEYNSVTGETFMGAYIPPGDRKRVASAIVNTDLQIAQLTEQFVANKQARLNAAKALVSQNIISQQDLNNELSGLEMAESAKFIAELMVNNKVSAQGATVKDLGKKTETVLANARRGGEKTVLSKVRKSSGRATITKAQAAEDLGLKVDQFDSWVSSGTTGDPGADQALSDQLMKMQTDGKPTFGAVEVEAGKLPNEKQYKSATGTPAKPKNAWLTEEKWRDITDAKYRAFLAKGVDYNNEADAKARFGARPRKK